MYFGLAENLRTGTTTLDDLRNLGLNEQQFQAVIAIYQHQQALY